LSQGRLAGKIQRVLRTTTGRNGKGCDFGYALAANSCEGVTGVDACTVAAS
jgi:hypothetical protein